MQLHECIKKRKITAPQLNQCVSAKTTNFNDNNHSQKIQYLSNPPSECMYELKFTVHKPRLQIEKYKTTPRSVTFANITPSAQNTSLRNDLRQTKYTRPHCFCR